MQHLMRNTVQAVLALIIGWGVLAAGICAMLGYSWVAAAANAAVAVVAAAVYHYLYGRGR
jgi:hypothetical protein